MWPLFLTILQCYQMSVVNLNPAVLLLIWKIMAKTMTTVCNDLEISETYEAKCSYKSFWSLLFSSITTDKRMLHPFPFPYIHLILFVCGKTTFYVKINMSAVIFLFFFHFICSPLHGKKTPQSLGCVCAGRTAALCQFSSARQANTFHAKSNQVAQIVKGTVDAVRGCQARN